MPNWDRDYYKSLVDRFNNITYSLDERLEAIIDGRVAPSADDLSIGTGKRLRAASLYFDIRSFSDRTSSSELANLKSALLLLNCVIPMVMHIIYDFGGYVEKNTGDGVMAIVGVEGSDEEAANFAIDIAITSFYVLDKLINPYLESVGIAGVNARIGIDLGTLLLARIGTPKGSSKHERSFLTAVGPAANLACRLQQMAGTNQIWVGDLIKRNAKEWRQKYFRNVTPITWGWHYNDRPDISYKIWEYNASRAEIDHSVKEDQSLTSILQQIRFSK